MEKQELPNQHLADRIAGLVDERGEKIQNETPKKEKVVKEKVVKEKVVKPKKKK